jgi:hypothetical protein
MPNGGVSRPVSMARMPRMALSVDEVPEFL